MCPLMLYMRTAQTNRASQSTVCWLCRFRLPVTASVLEMEKYSIFYQFIVTYLPVMPIRRYTVHLKNTQTPNTPSPQRK